MPIMMDAGYSISQCELLCQQLGAYLNTCSYGRPNFSVKNWRDCVPLTQEPTIVNLAKVLFSVVPHTAKVERTLSLFDWIQSERRNCLSVEMMNMTSFINNRLVYSTSSNCNRQQQQDKCG
jgi:hypothetical protein